MIKTNKKRRNSTIDHRLEQDQINSQEQGNANGMQQ